MKHFITLALCMSIATCAPMAPAAERRDPKQRAEFVKANPCPATGKQRGACPGYVVDHIKPLACGGPDKPENMQWQTVEEAKAKDRIERIGCKH